MNVIIGIGEYCITDNADDVLKTYALASCVGVTFYSKEKQVAGMIHISLPNCDLLNNKTDNMGCYATIGIPKIVNEMIIEYGCLKKELIIRLFGGASSIKTDDCFNIGKKNVETIISILKTLELNITSSDIGGFISRTLSMEVKSGNIIVETQPINI